MIGTGIGRLTLSRCCSGSRDTQFHTRVTDGSGITSYHTLSSFASAGEIPDDWKFNQHTLTRLRLGQGITYIGKNAFDGCNGLQDDLLIPSGVTEIDVEAFQGCHGLTGTL